MEPREEGPTLESTTGFSKNNFECLQIAPEVSFSLFCQQHISNFEIVRNIPTGFITGSDFWFLLINPKDTYCMATFICQ